MVVLIRSQGGERSVTLKTNKDIEKEKSQDLKKNVLDILKSLKFELSFQVVDEGSIKASLNIVDLKATADLEALTDFGSPDAPNSDESDPLREFNIPGLKFDPPSEIIDAVSSQLAAATIQADEPTLPIPVELEEKPTKKVTALSFAPLQVLRKQVASNSEPPVERAQKIHYRDPPSPDRIRKISAVAETRQLSTTSTNVKQAAPIASTDYNAELAPPRPTRISLARMKQIKEAIDQEPVAPKTRLIRGTLEIGKAVTTTIMNGDASTPDEYHITYDIDKMLYITQTLEDMDKVIEAQPTPANIEVDDYILVKPPTEELWYRGIVTEKSGLTLKVFYFDWGITEMVNSDDCSIKALSNPELGTSKVPACAVKITFDDNQEPPEDEQFRIFVESYDEFQETYHVRLIS